MTISSEPIKDASQWAEEGKLPCPMCDGTGGCGPEQLGQNGMIISQRQLMNLTQAELAEKVGLSRAQITNIEAGRSTVPTDRLRAFAEALRMSPLGLIP